jgi:tRNA-splicing ligase RtcB
MSYKFSAQKVGKAHYVLERTGQMLTDVHAFLSEELFDLTDEATWKQAVDSASYPGALGMYLMPDCHLGYSIPVGGVLVTEGTIVQAGSGYDISCGVIYAKTGIKLEQLTAENRRKWVDAVDGKIATGYTGKISEIAAKGKFRTEDVLNYGAKAIGIKAEYCERQYIPVQGDFSQIEKAFQKAGPQLASVGGGNHFVELQVSTDGEVWLMVHCGSRGYGWNTADFFFKEGAKLRGIPNNRREESWLRIDEPLGQQYWNFHNSAANYAIANRHLIVEGIRQVTEQVFGAEIDIYYEISHNLVQEEEIITPIGKKKGFVHRKGATRAFPAGHSSLIGTTWEHTGHPVLIPGSMLHGGAILFPKNSEKSGFSVNHGSGRVLGRGEAKRELASLQAEIDDEMANAEITVNGVTIKGITTNTVVTPLDECGHAYKNLDTVLQVLVDEDIAVIYKRLRPVCNLKGAD